MDVPLYLFLIFRQVKIRVQLDMFVPNMEKDEKKSRIKFKDKFQLIALTFVLDNHIMKLLFMCCKKCSKI